jgi:hypothetical protein
MLVLKRRLYRLILRLHPASFRNRFAREMSLDCEDALATYGFPRLFADATRSLFCQWTAAPIFSASREQVPIPSHPLLAGHYMPLTDVPLTPFELLRGSMLFAVMLFALSLALKHGGNYIHTAHNVGLSGGAGNSSLPTSTSHAASHAPVPDYSQTLVIPTSTLPSRYRASDRNGRTIYVNPVAPIGRTQTASWKEFRARCAIISAIVWLTSFLLRRAKTVGARVAYVAAGFSFVAFAVLMPFHLADKSALAELQHSGKLQSGFESATIHLHQNLPATHYTPANLVHIDSPIRTLLADVSNVPPSSIVGGPGWLDTDSYDITATIDPATLATMQKMSIWQQRSQVRWMEQELLVDRFHLKLHVENRQLDAHTSATIKTVSASAQPAQILVIDSIERPSGN